MGLFDVFGGGSGPKKAERLKGKVTQKYGDPLTRQKAISQLGDALISLSSPGPAPIYDDSQPRPTGDAIFNYASSTLGAPAVTVPLIGVSGMPVGVQIMGQLHADARVTAVARWIAASVAPVKIKAR